MKTHYTEENDDALTCNDTADDHCWREHQIESRQILRDLVILVLALIGVTFLSGTRAISPPIHDALATQSQALPPVFAHRFPSILLKQTDPDDDR